MARTRNIKPSFFMNSELGELEPCARLLFAGLWCHADREGRIEDRPKQIKASILPYDDCDCDTLLTVLAARGFVTRYEVSGIKVVEITNFVEHQTPHPKEMASSLPAMEKPGKNTASSGKAGNRKRRKEKDLDLGEGIKDLDLDPPPVEPYPPHCPEPPPSLNTPEGLAALWEWARYKSERRESYKSERGWLALFEDFQDLGPAALVSAVKNSIKNNWAGIFRDKSRQATAKNLPPLEIPDFDMEAA